MSVQRASLRWPAFGGYGLLGAAAGIFIATAPGTWFMCALILVGTALIARAVPRQDRPFVLALIGWGVALRVVLTALLIALSRSQGLAGWLLGDSLMVHNYAWLMNQYMQGDAVLVHETAAGVIERGTTYYVPRPSHYGFHGMTLLVATFYRVFGPMPWSIQLLNMFFGTLISVGIYAIAAPIFGRAVGRAAAVICLVWPSMVLWSLAIMKDSLYTLSGVGIIWALLRLQRTRRWPYLIFIIAWAAVQHKLRPVPLLHTALLLLGAVVAWSWLSRPHRWRALVLSVVLAAGLLAVYRQPVAQYARVFMKEAVDRHWAVVVSTPGWNYQIFDPEYYVRRKVYTTVPFTDFVKGLGRGLGYFFFAPFLWTLDGHLARLAAYPQMVCWYLVLLWVPLGIWRAWQRDRLATALVLGYVIPASAFIAIGSGNWGTLVRHRDVVSPFYLMFSMAGLLPAAMLQRNEAARG